MPEQYAVVMFAHNEQDNIIKSVNSIFQNCDEQLERLLVIANGCSDDTVVILKRLQTSYAKLVIQDLEIGDKCNAWNRYVHEYSIDSSSTTHFFVDADVRFTNMAFPKMSSTLRANTSANAIAGLPFSGRNIQQYTDMVTNGLCLFGNCYGLKYEFITLLREKKFKLPIGLGWIDSAITKMINRDIEDIPNPKKGKITFNSECGYEFDSLSIFKKSDWTLYINRIARYRLGQLQEKYLEKIGFTQWPENLLEINVKVFEDIRLKSPWYHLLDKRLVANRIVTFAKKLNSPVQ
jgi:glycosyltransferase involved in cell wall biosynthesis